MNHVERSCSSSLCLENKAAVVCLPRRMHNFSFVLLQPSAVFLLDQQYAFTLSIKFHCHRINLIRGLIYNGINKENA